MISSDRKLPRWALAAVLTTTSITGLGLAAAAPASAAPASPADYRCEQNDTWRNGSLYLDVSGSGGSGTRVVTWYYNGHANQHWCLERAREGGWYFHPSYNLGLCLDVPYSNYTQGQSLWVFSCNGTGAQRFSVTGSGGYYNIGTEDAQFSVNSDGHAGDSVYLNQQGDATSWQ
ncbi:RICIN domain-containing protein [Catenulispora subtropica]|uniref:Ricin B lectin domain-containing protein n=1 Tax=Catenulispora subtropica TaxID=450798 RepID=A0ABP5CE24_9ACTN